jgi:trehalose 6-phosphate phosphatase
MRLIDDLDRLASAYRDGRSLALLFDFDGTLAPLVTHPDLATCPPAILNLLTGFSNLPRVLVGIISGRALADLRTKISVPGLAYVGSNGLEMQLDDRLIDHPEASRFAPVLGAAMDVASAAVRQFPGAWIEQKPLSFTVHYRQVRRDDVALCAQCVATRLSRFSGVLECQDGSMALDVLPALGWSKGEALDAIITNYTQDAVPLYAGNDGRDVGAMLAAERRGGVSVGVGPEAPPEAQYSLEHVENLIDHLAEFMALLGPS